ncbi:MAG: hypothetical protein R2695_01630 [Acidimicrobiales bacterium]
MLGPVLVMLGIVRIVVSVSSVVRSEMRLVASDRVQRAAAQEMYEIASTVDLARFDDPEFHDRLSRAHDSVEDRIWSTVWSLVALGSAAITLTALFAVLIVVAPLVLLFAVVGAPPLWIVRRRNNEAEYRMAYEFTEEDREASTSRT